MPWSACSPRRYMPSTALMSLDEDRASPDSPVAARHEKRLTEAKLLAWHSQFAEARQFSTEVESRSSPIPRRRIRVLCLKPEPRWNGSPLAPPS
jgi:hypothetical protein